MNSNHNQACQNSIEFVKNFFKLYLEERDFDRIALLLHEDASWFGTGAEEACKNYQETIDFINAQREVNTNHYSVDSQLYEAAPINDEFCIVYCSFNVVKKDSKDLPIAIETRSTVICAINGDDIKLYHIHTSVSNVDNANDEYSNMAIINEYNGLLEKRLQERTKMLLDKSNELEALANNIYCGVEICLFDEDFTFLYLSEGFSVLTGYSQIEAIELLDNKHSSLMFDEEIQHLKGEISRQLETKNSFSVEYRIRRKDGEVIWVLDKGILINPNESVVKVQCILMDITEQKETEQALRLSEKRYEVAMRFSDITMFEYDIYTKDLILFENDANLYGVPTLIPNGYETLVNTGVVQAEYAEGFLEMYKKINRGEPTASCYIRAKDVDGCIHDYEMSLTNVFDDCGKPTRAIGARKNITHLRQLEREKEFSSTMASNQILTYEANISRNTIVSLNREWSKSLDIDENITFSGLTEAICENFVFHEDKDYVANAISAQSIKDAFESGKGIISIEYRKRLGLNEYHWFRKNINIIKDNVTGDINVRCYIVDINDSKTRELRALDERRIYENMVSKATIIYEVNITKNSLIAGHEQWGKLFGIKLTSVYSEMIDALCERAIHPGDVEGFKAIYMRQNVFDVYASGKSELLCDYRRPDEDGNFRWFRCSLHLFEDPQTGDLKGHAYIENIDDEKIKQLELIHKSEHDALTGLYNKAATEKHIRDFLSTSEGKAGKHAFFIIDIDYFKAVNDNFGHAFGDAVLSQLASKIDCLFRDIDILGRVGGDEFIAFMKNISSRRAAMEKAQEIRDKVVDSFTKSNTIHSVSASIGIAVFKEHGRTYDELYVHSDTALYVSKKSGRNRHTVYSGDMGISDSSVKEINQGAVIEPKMFEGNIAEYVFRILYESNNKIASIGAVLELLGKQYDVSRAYVFEASADGYDIDNTFEWCAPGIMPQDVELQKTHFRDFGNYADNFSSNGTFLITDSGLTEKGVRDLLEPRGIKSMLQFPILKNGKLRGIIGFDECRAVREESRSQITGMQNISNILGVFITEMRAIEETTTTKNAALSIINGLSSCAYVCDPLTYKIVFANDMIFKTLPQMRIDSLCYEVLWNRTSPCEPCIMETMQKNNLSKYSMTFKNSNIGKLVKVNSSWIDWVDGKQKCLIDCIDLASLTEG